MAIEIHCPQAPLAELVTQVWHCEDYVLSHPWERIMPTCGVTLLVNLADDELRWRSLSGPLRRLRGIVLCGPQPSAIEIDTAQQRFIMGVEFELGAAARLFGVPTVELAATHVSLADIVGHEATLLAEQLAEGSSPRARFRILCDWIARRAARRVNDALPLWAVRRASSLLDERNVGSVAAHMNLSAKRFIRHMRNHVGLAPKLFCRVRRFERLLATIERCPAVDWALAAAGHGYYDQAHLAHEFRSLSGYWPSEYLERRGPYARHVPLFD